MTDYIDRCLDEGLPTMDEYFDLIEAGDDDFASDPEVCIHEAGHAVAGYIVGRPIESVSAEEWGDDDGIETPDGGTLHIGSPGGLVRYAQVVDRPLTEAETAARMYREIITALAGGYATHRYTGVKPDGAMSDGDRCCVFNAYYSFCELTEEVVEPPCELPDSDRARSLRWQRKHFERWCEAEQPPVSKRDLWAEVARIIDEHWHLVEGLAAVLTRQPYLSGPQVCEIFGRIETRRAASR